MKKIAIIDYQMSNLFSVKHACDAVGISAEITADKSQIAKATGLILPGVGAFGDAMNNLQKLGLLSVIKDSISQGKYLLGVCLGMQLLLDESYEFGHHQGLGLIPGSVKRFPAESSSGQPIKAPQIGWNTIFAPQSKQDCWQKTPLETVGQGEFVYFVHSYYVEPKDTSVVLSLTNYSDFEYCSSLAYKNVFAFQFHPEKSGPEGIKIYRNWASLIPS